MTDKSKLLRRVELLVLKNKSTSDTAQVPSGATVYVYVAGPVVSTTTVLLGTNTDPPPLDRSGRTGLRRSHGGGRRHGSAGTHGAAARR